MIQKESRCNICSPDVCDRKYRRFVLRDQRTVTLSASKSSFPACGRIDRYHPRGKSDVVFQTGGESVSHPTIYIFWRSLICPNYPFPNLTDSVIFAAVVSTEQTVLNLSLSTSLENIFLSIQYNTFY